MRYVVGYGPDRRGIDGLNLAVTLARGRGVELDIVTVLPAGGPTFHMYSPDRAYSHELEKQGSEWLDDAMSQVPSEIKVEGHLRRADSIAEGLTAEATDPGRGPVADLIVVGNSRKVRTGRLRLGSIADALLHSASVPVALAPAGYEMQPAITRVTCATGTREGSETLLAVAIREAAERRIPLRLMSLVAVGRDGSDRHRLEWVEIAQRHVAELSGRAVAALPEDCPTTTTVGHGDTLEEAVAAVDFSAGELVMVGSSRLAQPKRLFIGASVNKILRALPVPMVVVPRDYEPDP